MSQTEQRPYWFVGAAYGGTDDKTQEFLTQGCWATDYTGTDTNERVMQVRPGDRIAIKANFTQKKDLPFNSNGKTVSAMRIKAIGTVKANPGDGSRLEVDWQPVGEKKNWYLSTCWPTISSVYPNSPEKKALIDFTFGSTPQDFAFFLSLPKWKERFSATPTRFLWTDFYMAFADALLRQKANRTPLLEKIRQLSLTLPLVPYTKDVYADGFGTLNDICPFTVLGIFNRGLTDTNRIAIASGLASFLGVTVPVPQKFDGIPVLNNQRSWFFRYAKERESTDIPALWNFFETAIKLAAPEGERADEDYEASHNAFVAAYDTVSRQPYVSWNLTIGLYWIRPWFFPSLDTLSRKFIPTCFASPRLPSSLKGPGSGLAYLKVKENLESAFEGQSSITSFPALSLAAWESTGYAPTEQVDEDEESASDGAAVPERDGVSIPQKEEPYCIDSIIAEDCFLNKITLEKMLGSLKKKKNLILQGPPGTGKTWLAKRLAQALIGFKNTERIRSLQFHATLSYEDFVRGWRPAGEGKLALCDGPFLEMIDMAALPGNESQSFVMVIEEINRGNPAQIFGELLTLLEADKRNNDYSLRLCYQKDGECRDLFIPENLYIIGTMNIADRSLALVDFALRRRFAFFTLEPCFNNIWESVLQKKGLISPEVVAMIREKMTNLNASIAEDPSLRAQYAVGHSYVTPTERVEDAIQWFEDVIETEITPLLQEYWFDNKDKLSDTIKELKKGLR